MLGSSSALWALRSLAVLATLQIAEAGGGARYCPSNATAYTLDPACHCNDKDSFLGVANVTCLGYNINSSCVLTFLIVALSFVFEQITHKLKHFSHDEQMQRIIDHLLEEVMILGFISMTFFVMMVNGLNDVLAGENCKIRKEEGRECLTEYQLFHFQEFFHYAIFLTMVYYIISVSCLVFASNYIPKLWERTETRLRTLSRDLAANQEGTQDVLSPLPQFTGLGTIGENAAASSVGDDGISDDIVTSRYAELKERRRAQGWKVKLRPRHWWNWWLCVVRMGYKLARGSSMLVYKNPELMAQAFNLPLDYERTYSYPSYNIRCTRSVLLRVLRVHWSSWAVLWFFMMGYTTKRIVNGENGGSSNSDQEEPWAHVEVVVEAACWTGLGLLVFSLVLAAKTFKILMGLVNDRVEVQGVDAAGNVQARVNTAEGVHMIDSTWHGLAEEHAEEEEAQSEGGASSSKGGGKGGGKGGWGQLRSRAKTVIEEEHSKGPRTAQERMALMSKHRDRFWCGSPKLLLQLVQFSFFFQSIYLAVVSLLLVEVATRVWLGFGAVLIVLFPLLIVFVVTPFTLPTLVLSLDLTGYIGADRLVKLEAKRDGHGHGHGHGDSEHGHGHGEGGGGHGGAGGFADVVVAATMTVQRRKKVAFCPVCGDERDKSKGANATGALAKHASMSGLDKHGRWDCAMCGATALPTFIITKEKRRLEPESKKKSRLSTFLSGQSPKPVGSSGAHKTTTKFMGIAKFMTAPASSRLQVSASASASASRLHEKGHSPDSELDDSRANSSPGFTRASFADPRRTEDVFNPGAPAAVELTHSSSRTQRGNTELAVWVNKAEDID